MSFRWSSFIAVGLAVKSFVDFAISINIRQPIIISIPCLISADLDNRSGIDWPKVRRCAGAINCNSVSSITVFEAVSLLRLDNS